MSKLKISTNSDSFPEARKLSLSPFRKTFQIQTSREKYSTRIMYPQPTEVPMSPVLKDFIMKCLEIKTEKRPSIREILTHDFLKN